MISVTILILATSSFLLGSQFRTEQFTIIAIYVLMQGGFDAKQATLRAKFELVDYSRNWILKSALSFSLALSAAYWLEESKFVLSGLALSFLLGIPFIFNIFRRKIIPLEKRNLFLVAKYGWLISLSSLAASAFIIWTKYIAKVNFPYNTSAGIILSFDLSSKILMAIGMAANIIFLQYSIRSIEKDEETEFRRKNRSNISVMTALIVPAGIGFLEIQDFIIRYFVPPDYVNTYQSSLPFMIAGTVIMALRVYVVDTQFVISGKAIQSLGGAIAALFSFYILWEILYRTPIFRSSSVGLSILISSIIGFIFSLILSSIYNKTTWPAFNLFKICISCIAMYPCKYLFISDNLIANTSFIIIFSVFTYFLSLYLLNFNGFRQLVYYKYKGN